MNTPDLKPREKTADAADRLQLMEGMDKDSTPKEKELWKRLLFIGGDVVAVTEEIDIDEMLSRAVLFRGPVKMKKGKPSRCHGNSANLWRDGVGEICTGWSLTWDDDGVGCWRQHTWVVAKDFIIETTSNRAAYYGFILTTDEAKRFAKTNY